MKTNYTLHAAPWVVPVSEPPIAEGAVVFYRHEIVAVGKVDELMQKYPEATVEYHRQAVLTPPLTNAHVHLELSHLAELSSEPPPDLFTDWILSLIELRDRLGATGSCVEEAAQRIAENQYASGVSTIIDIGNTDIGSRMGSVFSGTLYAFREYLGFHGDRLPANLARLEAEQPEVLCSAHAIYSTHVSLLQALHRRATANGYVLPIHVAEPKAEISMIRHGQGEMVDFLKARGFWDEGFTELIGESKGGTVSLLHRLGMLDQQTLCIHCVHVTDAEVEMLAAAGAKVCLCPGSNRYLQVGTPPVEKYIDAGILPALGTDSLASNQELSLWREMMLLAADHPAIDHQTIFSMATRGGAEAVGLGALTGTLAAGSRAEVLKVHLPEESTAANEVMSYLVTTGSAIQPVRISDIR